MYEEELVIMFMSNQRTLFMAFYHEEEILKVAHWNNNCIIIFMFRFIHHAISNS